MTNESASTLMSAALTRARAAVAGIQDALWRVSGSELSEVLRALDEVGAAVRGATVAVAAEALVRGEVRSSQSGNMVTWLRDCAPSLRQGGAKAVAECAQLVAGERRGLGAADGFAGQFDSGSAIDAGGSTDRDGGDAGDQVGAAESETTPTRIVGGAVLRGELLPAVAVTVLGEFARLERRLRPEAHTTVTSALVSLGRDWGSAQARKLRPRLLADYGLPGELQADQDTLARHVTLSSPIVDDGLTAYQLVLDPQSAAVLEAAIGPLAAPTPNPETGERDLRSAGQRRASALIEVCRRATAAGHGLMGGAKTALFVTMDIAHLRGAVSGAGTVVGTPAAGVLLAPETVRRLACDAEIVPVVLGSRGEVLDLGASVRFFSKAQTRVLWLRDDGCSFPGCSVPAHWCDAHHIVHWADGGKTGLDNAALLCGRHHEIVHRDRLIAHVLDPPGDQAERAVRWDCSPGSYDRALPHHRAA